MGCRVLYDAQDDSACLYDSVTMTAFGRVFSGPDAEIQAQAFLDWLSEQSNGRDPRKYTSDELGELQDEWLALFTDIDKPDWACETCEAEPWHACSEETPEHPRVLAYPRAGAPR